MKLRILLVTCIFFSKQLSAQDFSTIKDVVLTDSVSCVKAQNQVLECAEYLLNNPCKQELNSLYANDFIIQWMTKTSNYSFTIHQKFYKSIQSDVLLASRYYASMAKLAIEKNTDITSDDMQYEAIKEFLKYCSNTKNKVVINKKLQKYIDAHKSNTLRDML
jgi:hypothetical protein